MYKLWVIGLLILAAILFGYAWYKVDQLARAVNCLYIPIDHLKPECVNVR